MESCVRGLCMLTAWALGRQSQPWSPLHYPEERITFRHNRLGNGLVDVLVRLACRTAISQFIGAAQGALNLEIAKVIRPRHAREARRGLRSTSRLLEVFDTKLLGFFEVKRKALRLGSHRRGAFLIESGPEPTFSPRSSLILTSFARGSCLKPFPLVHKPHI